MSEGTEMYLVTIGQQFEGGVVEPPPLSLLAEELAIKFVSANEMVHKMQERGLVIFAIYLPGILTAVALGLILRRTTLDAVTMMAAMQCKAKYLLTRNENDLRPALLPVVKPVDLLGTL